MESKWREEYYESWCIYSRSHLVHLSSLSLTLSPCISIVYIIVAYAGRQQELVVISELISFDCPLYTLPRILRGKRLVVASWPQG